ncbi:MAG: DHA2 family efflux MFS transporter permease subunit [Actinomycetes bacterium]
MTTNSDRSRWVALYVLCIGMLMIVLDVTVVNVALPSIQADLGFSTSSLAWVVNAYLISFGGLLLLAGRLGDLVGRRRVFLAGLALFTGASLLCGLAQSQSVLVGARFLQGVGGAMTSAVILGMIVTMFPEPREQAKAIGVYGFVASAGGSVGLLAGGALTQSINWHWIFFVNVPIGLVTAVLATRYIDNDTGIGMRAGADVPGALLVTGALMVGVFTIVKPAAESGWTSLTTIAGLACTVVLVAGFVVREATATTPLMPLRIFKLGTVAGANIVQTLGTAGMFGMFFLGSLYLQSVLGYGALQIGLAFLPTCVVMGVLSLRYSERLITRFGAKASVLAGLAVIALAMVLFAQAPVAGNYVRDVLPATALMGLGAGVCFPALMGLAMQGVAPEEAGLASGLVNTTAEAGGALGLAVLATLSTARAGHLLGAGHPTAAALTGGYHLAFLVGAGLVLAAIAVGALMFRTPRPKHTAAAAPATAPAAGMRPAYCETA